MPEAVATGGSVKIASAANSTQFALNAARTPWSIPIGGSSASAWLTSPGEPGRAPGRVPGDRVARDSWRKRECIGSLVTRRSNGRGDPGAGLAIVEFELPKSRFVEIAAMTWTVWIHENWRTRRTESIELVPRACNPRSRISRRPCRSGVLYVARCLNWGQRGRVSRIWEPSITSSWRGVRNITFISRFVGEAGGRSSGPPNR
jgi:hypothetical protein